MKMSARVCGGVWRRVPQALLAIVAVLTLVPSLAARERLRPSLRARPAQALPAGPKIWLQGAQPLQVTHVGSTSRAAIAARTLAAGQGQPLSMIDADFDEDGVEDLIVGYATPSGGALVFHRGNLDAFAPQSDVSFQAIAHGQFPPPFLPQALVLDIPIQPDFLAAGDFTGTGDVDLAVAARGGASIYIFPGNGKGNFGQPQILNVSAGIMALAAGSLGAGHSVTDLIAGIAGPKTSSLLILGRTGVGLGAVANYPLTAPASSILFGDFGGHGQDVAFLSGGQVSILRSSSMQITPVSLSISVSAMALGSFVYDRNGGSQIALLGSDGSIHIAVRNEFDPRSYTVSEFKAIRQAKLNDQTSPLVPIMSFPVNGWKIVETFPAVASFNLALPPVLFRTRISDNGADDVMVLNGSTGTMAVISHPDLPPGAQTFLPGQVSLRPYSGTPLNALPMRVNVDGRPGVVAIHQGDVAPWMIMPIPDPTFFPNRFDDIAPRGTAITCLNTTGVDASQDCTLREAIIKANATAGTDTIMLQAGTYTLQQGRAAAPLYDAQTGTLNVNDSLNIIGAGQNSTVITWGIPISGSIDMVIAVNEDISIISNATASISNLTIQNGVNHGTHGNDGDGGCMEFDTGSSGNANLTFTNVTLQGCSTTQGNGAGIAIFNFLAPNNGLVTFSGSIVQNNSAVDTTAGVGAGGGGIWVSQNARMSMTSSQVLNNSATQVNGTGKGIGGGIFLFTNTPSSRQTVIHASTISGNKSAGFGGGIYNLVNLLVDQGTVISGNTAGTDGINPIPGQFGGGLYDNTSSNGCPGACTDTVTLTKVVITGNTATGSGGGIYHGNNTGAGSLTMNFSRLAGNTANTSGSNLFEDHSVATATNNWWGTNSPAATITNNAGTATFDPFIMLTHTASPQTIHINQSATLTGDMGNDNHGNAIGLTNLTAIIGLPITFDNAILGTIPQAQPEALNANAQATATFNAGGTAGLATAHATVDQAVIPVNSSLIASATEAGTTATITTVGAHGFSAGEFVSVTGVGAPGYNGNFLKILSTPTPATFTYTASTSGLGPSSGGTANAGIVILQPPSITKTFNPKTIQTTAGTGATVSTITFALQNQNVIPINASFTDNLPTNVGIVPGSLVVASTPTVINSCGGTVTAVAGAGNISFSNTALPVGTCTVQVNVQSAVDNNYNNSVTIDSTDAGNGNTSSDTLAVINPPHIVKTFGQPAIPFGSTTSLNFSVSNPNQNQSLSAISFIDVLPNAAPGTLVGASSVTASCVGTTTGGVGSGSVSLSGSSLAPGASCGVSLTVQGTAVGAANNSVTVSDSNAGTGNTSIALLTVVKSDTTTTVTSSANPSVFGQSATFTATVSPVAPGSGTPTGTVTFLDGGSPIGTGTLSGGVATFTTSAMAIGNHTLTTSYGGNGNFNGSTGSLTGNPQVVNKTDTTTTVTSSANPSVFGQSVTFTGTVSPVAPGAGTPTGTVTFLDGGSPVGTGTLSGGIATFTTSALAIGNHTVTTSYGGDGNFNGSTGSLTGNPQVVNKADTSATVTSSQNPSVFGQSTTFTATVSPVAPGAGTATGTVTFLDGGSPIGTGTLSGGVATFTTSALAVGNHTVTTSYGGDANFNGSTGSLTGNPQVVNKSDTTTTVTSSANPSVFGQSATFTATLSPVAPGAGTPTGTVTFLDGGSPIGTGTLSGGIATFTTSALAAGNHTITTNYGGDGNFNGSTGSLTGNPQVVNKANTATTVTSSQNPSVFGQPATFTATVSPVAPGAGTPTGTVTFLDGGSPIGTGTLSGGVATFTTSALAIGNHTITTSYGGDGNFNGSTGSLTGNPQVVSKANTATTVTSSQNPSVFGQSVTLTATVSPVAPAAGTPTGTVTFLDGGSPIGTGTLSGGIATFTTSALAIGNHTITTSYGGNGNFNGSSGSLTGNPQVVNKANSATTVTSSQNPSALGQSVTFTATVAPVPPGAGTPTGTVTFLDGGSPIGTGTLSGGAATFTTSALAIGNHTITTNYGGDGNFNGSTGSLTGNPQVINKANTTTALTSSQNPAVFGQSVTFTATVSAVAPATGTPSGTVTFLDGGSPIGTGTISAGVASFTTSALVAGNHTITTNYGGDASFNGSTGSLTGNPQVINKSNTTTALTSSQNPSVFGQSATFTATVSPAGPGAGTPTGTVTFLDGGSPIGTGTLGAGVATFTTSALAVGNHTITTSYSGDGNFNGSTGSLTGNPQVVNKTNSTTTVASSQNPAAIGQSVTFTATVSPVAPGAGTPTGTVTFLDGGTPIGTGTLSGAIATFTTSALATGNHTITTSYGGDGNFNGSTGSLTGNPQVINMANSATTVTSSQNSSALGQSVTFTATVSAVAPGTGTPTGSVTFLDGGAPIGTGTLNAGVATFSTAALVAGNHTITTSYGGDANFNGSTGSLTGNPQVVVAPPTITKTFVPGVMAPNGVTTMMITITNPPANTVPLAGLAFTDTFPLNIVTAVPNAITDTCGGTAVSVGGSGTLSLTGGTVAASASCSIHVNITASIIGTYVNTTAAVSSANGGTGNTASATLVVAAPPIITKAFGVASVALNGTTSLTFTITNPAANTVALNGVAFTDTLPNGLQLASPPGLTGSCGGGTITAGSGSSSVSLAGATLPVSGSCSIVVNVIGTVAGAKTNSVTVTSTTAGTGNTATASMTVVAPPALQKSFGAATVNLSASTSLTFTVTNPNTTGSLTSIAFTDNLPSGLIISSPTGLTGTCGGGSISAAAGSTSVSLSAATLAASASCTFSVNVTGFSGGVQNNTTSAINSSEGGAGVAASASLTVLTADLMVSKSHAGNFKQGQTGATYSITVSNQGVAPTVGTVSVTDMLPAPLSATAITGSGWTCTLATLTCSRADALANGASYPAITVTVNVSGVAPTSVTNTVLVAGGGESNTSNDTGTDLTNIDVVPPDFSIASASSTNAVKAGQLASFTFSLAPLNNVPVSTPITLSVTGLPPRTSASFQTGSVTPGLNPTTDTLVITTTLSDPYLAGNFGGPHQSRSDHLAGAVNVRLLAIYAAWLPMLGLALSGLDLRKRLRVTGKTVWLLILLGFVCCAVGLNGCASAQNFKNLGTPPGTYNVTVTATMANVQHSATVTLTVQP